jgi:large subunit ribosomal protein L4
MESLSSVGMKTLFVTANADKNTLLSARNIPRVAVISAADLNVLDVLNATRVVFAQDALPKLEERLQCN